ncbi:MAG: hypothetical protein K2K68_03155 [Duncaniella sp.]|nr:hypothetical protein [Duncaniella sp.]MDE6582959.1 hypothetical protein [Duncaniella sp.]
MKIFFKNLFQLILHPAHGWEDIARENVSARVPATRGLFPLIVLAALSVFMAPVYHSDVSVVKLVIESIATFSMFFPSYFIGTFVLVMFLGPSLNEPLDENRCRTFALYTIGLLTLITLILNCFPFLETFGMFMPIYVAIIQWKGALYLNVKAERTGHFMLLAVLGVLVPPYLIYFLFSMIIK